MKAIRLILIVLVIATAFGCAHDQERRKSAQEIFDEASLLASKGKIERATELFMEVRTYYPGHDLARKSLLATADLNYDKELYDAALENYTEYRLLYPTDFDAGYSLYKIGMCYFQQINTFDRDQEKTVRSIKTLEEFTRSYPDSPYVSEALDRLTTAKMTLARHYIYIGKFYLKKKNNEAACKRFREVKQQYPGMGLDHELDELIARSCGTAGASAQPR